ncbi:MAG TPA: hypothetical protein VHA74_03975 [Candidatus Dojkabacteria bacterium]|nr:hypothetical protein [Candidatus Dojkabacteria bacterium]
MSEYSATGAYTFEMLESVPKSIAKEAISIIETEIDETGYIPNYAYTLVVTRFFQYIHPLDGCEYLEVNMAFRKNKGCEEDILISPKSAKVVYKKNFIWEYYDHNISWNNYE